MVRQQFYLVLVEVTSLPLLVAVAVLVVSGYILRYPGYAPLLSYGLLSYGDAAYLHAAPLIRISFTLLVLLHSLGGLGLLIVRCVKGLRARLVLEVLSAAGLTALFTPPLLLDAVALLSP